MKGIGRQVQLGVARETSRGTAEADASYWIPTNDFTVDEKIAVINDEAGVGVVEDSVGSDIEKKWAEGSITAPIGDKSFPLFLYAMLGGLATTDNADSDASVKDHTVTVAQSVQRQALTLFVNDPLAGQDYAHALGVLDSLEITYEMGKHIGYTANFKAKQGDGATLTPANTSENRFMPHHVTAKIAADQSGLDGASAVSIKTANITFNGNTEEDYVLGSDEPVDFLSKQFSVEGTIEALWDSESTFKTDFLAGTHKALRLDMTNNDVTIGNSANPKITIDLYKVKFTELTRPFAINDVVKQTLSFKSHYSISDSKMLDIVCTNTVASY